MISGQADAVKQQVAAHWDRRASHFDEDFGHSIRTAAERAAWDRILDLVLAGRGHLDALDAGCGTGLCGSLIEPYVQRLVGIDLSSQMLAKARARNVYDDLVKAELTGYLLAHPESFGLIVSADTLVYFGPLEDALRAARAALRGDGLLIFTVEAADDKHSAVGCGYRLNPNGRYSHRQSYLSATIGSAGFTLLAMEPANLRNEGGKPVAGFVITCRRGGN